MSNQRFNPFGNWPDPNEMVVSRKKSPLVSTVMKVTSRHVVHTGDGRKIHVVRVSGLGDGPSLHVELKYFRKLFRAETLSEANQRRGS